MMRETAESTGDAVGRYQHIPIFGASQNCVYHLYRKLRVSWRLVLGKGSHWHFQMFSATVYDTTLDWLAVFDSTVLPSVPLLPFRLVSSPEYRLCGRSLRTAIPNAFFCPTSTSSRLPRVIPCKKPVICSLEGGHIRGGYLAKGCTRLGSYSKSTRPSRKSSFISSSLSIAKPRKPEISVPVWRLRGERSNVMMSRSGCCRCPKRKVALAL